MTPERYQRIVELFESACERTGTARDVFLDSACGGDLELRRDVEEMLAADGSAGGVLESPAGDLAAAVVRSEVSPTPKHFGPYEVLGPLGAGGMGEVFRARDNRLKREVAIKILPPRFAGDRDRLRRFEEEARAAGMLNHPNILVVFDVGVENGTPYLVTELLEGQTLRERLAGPIVPRRKAIEYVRQVAAGLSCAHEKGIVHRDLKPENIFLTSGGHIKILDFGLAKLLRTEPAEQSPGTEPGMLLGTTAYMSPEQASGRVVDHRTVPDLSADTERLLVHCLEKEPAERFQSGRDMIFALDQAASSSPSDGETSKPLPPILRRSSAAWLRAAILILTAAAGGWLLHAVISKPGVKQNVQLQRLTESVGLEETPALSPDGKTVAFVAEANGKRQIWVRLLTPGLPLAVTRDDADHFGPRWSADSASLIYYTPGAQAGEPGVISEISALGGTARQIVSATGPGDLSHDGRSIAFFRAREGHVELAQASRDGSNVKTIVKSVAEYATHLRWSPDDRTIAFQQEPGGATLFNQLLLADVSSGEVRLLSGDGFSQGFSWLPDGSGLVSSWSTASAMSYPPTMSLWRMSLRGGPPSQLTYGEVSYEFPDVGNDGRVVVSRTTERSDLWKFPVSGTPEQNARNGHRITRQTGRVQTASVSPDETEVAFLSDSSGHANVWIASTVDGAIRPVTRERDPTISLGVPAWSPSGSLINYVASSGPGAFALTLHLVRPDGSAPHNLGIAGAWACWSGDGKWIYSTFAENSVHRIRKVPVAGGQPIPVRDDNAWGCAVAPDGSALFYVKPLKQASGAIDYELRMARPETGPSQVLGRVPWARIPVGAVSLQPALSPDAKWLAMPLLDGSTANLWALSTSGAGWRKLTDFGIRNVLISRRVSWGKDSRSIYAAVAEVDSDIVLLDGLIQ